MKTSKSVLIIFITLLIGISLIAGGCGGYAKKPVPSVPVPDTPMTPTNLSPVPTTPNAATPAPTSIAEAADQAKTEAQKVMGVNKAAAVVADKTIYVGITLNADVAKTQAPVVEKNVMDRVTTMVPGYAVRVTSDMNTVASITSVAEGVAEGKPMASFQKEMDMITNSMKPTGIEAGK